MTKKRGRPQAAHTKALILRLLDAAPHGLTCLDLAERIGLSDCATRSNLIALIEAGSCTRIRVWNGCANAVFQYGVSTRELTPPPGFSVYTPISELDDQDDAPIIRFHIPAGQWRADHIPAVRSVFDLGVSHA